MTRGDAVAPDASAPTEPTTARRRLREWPITVVLAGVVVSLVVVALGHFRRGSVLLAATVLFAVFLRLLLRDDEAGLLAVRSKTIDVAVLAVLGAALAVLAFAVPPPA